MRYIWAAVAVGIILLAGLLFVVRQSATAQQGAPTPAAGSSGPQTGPAGSIPELPSSLQSFTVNNPYCYQPDPSLNQCYINIRWMQGVDNNTSAPYMLYLSISISSKVRYMGTAFFENAINYSYDMAPGGFKVPCGGPNASGLGAAYGFAYSVVMSPLDSSRSPMMTDTASTVCPAFAP